MGKLINKIVSAFAALAVTFSAAAVPVCDRSVTAAYGTVPAVVEASAEKNIAGEFHPVLRPFDSRKYYTKADIISVDNTDDLIAVTMISQDRRELTVGAATEGTAEITVSLSDGDVYKIYVTVDENAETTPVTTETNTVTTTSTTTSAAASTTGSTTMSTAASTMESTTASTTSVAATLRFDPVRDIWSFNNSSPKFRNRDGMILLDNELEKLEQIKKLYGKHTLNEAIDRFISSPQGACYGMSLLDLAYLSDREHYLPLIQEGAESLSSIKLTDEIKSRINYYSLLQIIPEVQYAIADSLFNENDASKLKRIIDETKNGPVLVCYCAKQSRDTSYAHAVLAYDTVSYVPDTDTDQEFLKSLDYDPQTDSITIIKVYDPKYTEHNDEADIFVNTKNKGTENERLLWGIKENYTYNMSISDKSVMFVSADLDLLNRYSLFRSFDSQSIGSQEMYPQFSVRTDSESGENKRYRIKVDPSQIKWIGSDEPDEEPYVMSPVFFSDGSGSQFSSCILKYPELDYNFEYAEGESSSAEIRMSYTNLLFGIKAENLSSVHFSPDGVSFELEGDSEFEVSAVSDEQANQNEFYSITLAGTASGKVELKNDNGHWQITTEKPLENADIYASNDSDCDDQHRSYTSGSNTMIVMYSKQNKTRIGISEISETTTTTTATTSVIELNDEIRTAASAADIDNDGRVTMADVVLLLKYTENDELSAETAENVKTMGDIDGSNAVEKNDADLLIAYIKETSTECDVNEDGILTAADATYILKYAADYANEPCDDMLKSNRCKYLGDINGDGKINGIDASFVLVKYADMSA